MTDEAERKHDPAGRADEHADALLNAFDEIDRKIERRMRWRILPGDRACTPAAGYTVPTVRGVATDESHYCATGSLELASICNCYLDRVAVSYT